MPLVKVQSWATAMSDRIASARVMPVLFIISQSINSEISFIDEHLKGQEYLPWSFFKGATPANNYTPSKPYKITVKENPYSYQNAGYATLYVHSGGADSDRAITVRKKESTGEWFLWTHAGFLASIRIPDSEDPWK